MSRWESIGPPPVSWGETLCSRRGCAELAVLLFEGWAYCLDCGEDVWERAVASEIDPLAVAELFPSLADR